MTRLELRAEQADDELAEWHEAAWLATTGLPLTPPSSPEDEETFPIDPERTAV